MITVKELKEKLSKYPDDYSVITKKTEITGNVGYINSIREDSYGFFGANIPCVLLTDEWEEEERCEDRCELCKYYRNLHHNFVKGKGYEESHCCLLFCKEKDAFVLEVEPQGICEMFTEFTTGTPDAMIRCRNCEYLYFTDNRVPSEQSYECDHWHTDITNLDGFCNFAKRKSN